VGWSVQYTTGPGDYAAQREELFADVTLDSIVAEIKETRKRDHSAQERKPPGRKPHLANVFDEQGASDRRAFHRSHR
jgi:hypothetical protein